MSSCQLRKFVESIEGKHRPNDLEIEGQPSIYNVRLSHFRSMRVRMNNAFVIYAKHLDRLAKGAEWQAPRGSLRAGRATSSPQARKLVSPSLPRTPRRSGQPSSFPKVVGFAGSTSLWIIVAHSTGMPAGIRVSSGLGRCVHFLSKADCLVDGKAPHENSA